MARNIFTGSPLFVAKRVLSHAKPENCVGKELVLYRIRVNLLTVLAVSHVHLNHTVFVFIQTTGKSPPGITFLTPMG